MNKDSQTRRPGKGKPVYTKGIVAIMSTVLSVVIITLIFAKVLFIPGSAEDKKTGRLTAPPSYSTTTTTLNTTTRKTTTTTSSSGNDPYKSELLKTGVTEMEVKSAVYLHPEPNSKSKNIMVLPQGARVTAYAVVNFNWIYVDYMGNVGYAYGDFFTGDKPTNTSVPDNAPPISE